jgi:DNA gyrase/topoisomerase IV subunit B
MLESDIAVIGPIGGGDLCVVNAVSDWMWDQAWSAGVAYGQSFRNGRVETMTGPEADADLTRLGERGVRVAFRPSGRFFATTRVDTDRLATALGELGSPTGSVSGSSMTARGFDHSGIPQAIDRRNHVDV